MFVFFKNAANFLMSSLLARSPFTAIIQDRTSGALRMLNLRCRAARQQAARLIRSVLVGVVAATLSIVSAGAQPFLSHGRVQFVNDGSASTMRLIPRDGNGIAVWCPASGQWQLQAVPSGGVTADANQAVIDGLTGQEMATDKAYLVGVRYRDAGCTVPELVLSSALTGPGTDYTNPNRDPVTGLNLLSGPTYTNVTLVGMVARDPILGIQGNGSSELAISWYNRGKVALSTTFINSTDGVLNAPVKLIPNGWGTPQPRLLWLMWNDYSPHIQCTFSVSNPSPANISAHVKITGAAEATFIQGVAHAGGPGMTQINIIASIEAFVGGLHALDAYLQTDAGTASAGVAYNSTCEVYTEY